jgi:hypothetical protein
MLPKLKIENYKDAECGIEYYPSSIKNLEHKGWWFEREKGKGYDVITLSSCLKFQLQTVIDERHLWNSYYSCRIRIPNPDYRNYWIRPWLDVDIYYDVKHRKRRIKKKCCDITIYYTAREVICI